jgi:hypothetical protein
MYADNVDFTGSTQPSPKVTANGQLLIGSAVAPNIRVATLTAGTGVSITNGAGTITIGLAGAGQAIDSIAVQTGTSPVAPDSNGLVTINGAVVAAGTNPVRSDGTGANTLAIEVQTSQALAAADATKIGLSNFDSTSFAVAATGFVTLSTTGAGKTITGDSGGALSPTANNWNILGSGSITTVGAASTLTVTLTGLTNHAVLVGAGTTTITKVGPTATAGQVLQSAGAAADPAFSTATYPLTTTVSQILYSSATNVVSGLATANRAVLTTGTTGIPVLTALAIDGQVIIGSTAGSPAAATLTAGTGISITNASNSITIATTGAGFAWTDVTGATQALSVENGYVTDRGGGVTYTLPATASLGDEIIIIGKLGLTTIAQNAGQSIRMSGSISTVGVGGSVAGTNVGDCITLNCTTSGASTVWIATSFVGNWTIT